MKTDTIVIKNKLIILKDVYTNVEFAYLLGAILGDGCLYVGKGCYQLSITSEDYDFCMMCFDIIVKLFGKEGNIKTVRKKDGVISYYQLVVCSKDIVYFFINETKDKTEIPPYIYKNKKMKKSFIQGLMDSDGWISKVNASDGYIRYRVGFKNISQWSPFFYDIFNQVGVKIGKLRKQSNKRSTIKAYTFTINTDDYCRKIGFRINRKVAIQKEYIDVKSKKNR